MGERGRYRCKASCELMISNECNGWDSREEAGRVRNNLRSRFRFDRIYKATE